MNNKLLLGALVTALFVTAACSAPSNTNANKAAASPSPSAAASPKPSAAASPAAPTEAAKSFLLVNSTGVDIHALYVTPSTSKDWESDILGRDTLPDGERTEIKFERGEKAPLWDMRVEDAQGNFIEWTDLNLLELKRVTLLYKNGKPTAETE